MFLHGAYDFPVLTIGYLPEDDPATVLLFVATLAVLTAELAMALTLARRVRWAQVAGAHERAVDPDYAMLEHHHRGPWHARDVISYGLLMCGALFAWVGGAALLMGGGDAAAAAVPAGAWFGFATLAVLAMGVVMFWRAIARLNRRQHHDPPGEAPP